MSRLSEIRAWCERKATFNILTQRVTKIRQTRMYNSRGLLLINAYKWFVIMVPDFSIANICLPLFSKLS